ncbi:hypothetical protein ACPPVT_14145 [Angustibacter sp. McL0619]|uniref:hypothetical protein n=1 Tax=Angustibacter sp. McL0619 TaxID=3415676 RepID=UPI003CF5C272
MGYEVLDVDRPGSGGRLPARPARGGLDVLDLESLPLSQPGPAARAATAAHPRRRAILVAAGLVAGLGLGGAWNAYLAETHHGVAEPVRTSATDTSGLTSRLTGPTSAPILLLHNETHHTVRVVIDPSSRIQVASAATDDVLTSRRVGATGSSSTLTSDPKLPVVLFADQTIAVLLRVRVGGCQPIESVDQRSLLLTGAPIVVAHTVPRSASTLVDLTSLVDAARSRSCGRTGQ